MELTPEQIKVAERLARRDYEVANLLTAYHNGVLDDQGVELLLEEISYAEPIESPAAMRQRAAQDLAREFGTDESEWDI